MAVGRQHVFRDAPPEFWMYSYKVRPCPLEHEHDRTMCPYTHEGEPCQRRHPSSYKSNYCKFTRAKKTCPDGDRCGFAHNLYEHWFHPDRFRGRMCTKGAACDQAFCFFAHSPAELRAHPDGAEGVALPEANPASPSGPARLACIRDPTPSLTQQQQQLPTSSVPPLLLVSPPGGGLYPTVAPSLPVRVVGVAAGPGSSSVNEAGQTRLALSGLPAGAAAPLPLLHLEAGVHGMLGPGVVGSSPAAYAPAAPTCLPTALMPGIAALPTEQLSGLSIQGVVGPAGYSLGPQEEDAGPGFVPGMVVAPAAEQVVLVAYPGSTGRQPVVVTPAAAAGAGSGLFSPPGNSGQALPAHLPALSISNSVASNGSMYYVLGSAAQPQQRPQQPQLAPQAGLGYLLLDGQTVATSQGPGQHLVTVDASNGLVPASGAQPLGAPMMQMLPLMPGGGTPAGAAAAGGSWLRTPPASTQTMAVADNLMGLLSREEIHALVGELLRRLWNQAPPQSLN